MNDLDLLTRLALIEALHDTPKKVIKAVYGLMPLVNATRQKLLVMLLNSRDPSAVIRQAIANYESN